MERACFLVRGVVQGVGFRPFCARLASEEGLKGSVRNTSAGVEIETWGKTDGIDRYLRRLQRECPTAGYIHSIVVLGRQEIEKVAPGTFEILKSEGRAIRQVLIPPDIATCDACVAEMRNPRDRRFRYPFINCTLCGPRFTIIRDLPYDRESTSMAHFRMCPDCHREYHESLDRRFHAQPNACHSCGPSLWACDAKGDKIAGGEEALRHTVKLLQCGKIVAVKGLGGFHLACDARLDSAVSLLRERKRRPHRPFAVMAKDPASAEKLVYLTERGRDCLTSSRRPIVLCQSRPGSGLSPFLNPGLDTIGVMLPYTPVHHLLLENLDALVMTSANMSEEPIVADNEEALRKLGPLVDAFLMHDRDIHMRVDDSVVSVAGNRSFYTRRARGLVPLPLFLDEKGPSVLAAGAEMKSTFSVTHQGNLFPSQYLGDLKDMPASDYYREALVHFLSLYGMKPRFLVHDLHPQYLSTRICTEAVPGLEGKTGVQHHHAHLAACLFENGHREPAVGLILDGTGYGTDGTVWGGEFLWGDATFCERLGSLLPFSLPGGEKAIWEPWRTAYSLVMESCGSDEASKLVPKTPSGVKLAPDALVAALKAGPRTTSCGRLFDGVSSLLGYGDVVSYDGQAPMFLEAASRGSGTLPFSIFEDGSMNILDWRPAIRAILGSSAREAPGRLAASFHNGFALSLAEITEKLAKKMGTNHVALSGGVWQNRRLFTLVSAHLGKRGLHVLAHTLLSPNDECVSVGQAVIGHEKWRA